MSDDANKLLIDRLNAKDELVFQQGDTLDVKASIVLVAVTFLGTQSADLLSRGHLTLFGNALQVAAAASVALAGIFVWAQLWPRDYEIEAAEQLGSWKSELEEFYQDEPDASQMVTDALQQGLIARAEERIGINTATNNKRSKLLLWSYILTTVALGLNLLTLFGIRLIQRPS